MSGVARIIWSSVGIAIALALMVLAVIYGYSSRPSDTPCAALEYIIEDRAERMYLTENELTALLRAEDIYPVGRAQRHISLHRIERAVARHPRVRTAECYITPRQVVKVRLTQRVPVLRVQTPIDTYLIDTDRKVMQARSAVRDKLLLATGTVGVQIASGQLTDFALWLQDNDYWADRIHHVQVHSPQMVYLYLRDDNGKMRNERIVLGPMRGYESKLNKLRVFMLNSTTDIQQKNYTELDLRFKGQVIGRY